MRADQLLLTVHLLAVASWIGGAVALQVLGARLGPSTDGAVVDRFALDAEAVGKTVFGPAGALVLLTGAALVVRQDLSWTEPWILLGLGLLIATGAIAGVYLIPEARRLAVLAGVPGHDVEEVRLRSRRRLRVARVDLTLLVVAVAVMVFRPGA